MQETEPTRWFRLTHSLSAKLNLLLVGAMVAIFSLLGYLTVHLHQQHLEQDVLLSAERVSDVIRRSTADYMLRNDRDALHRTIRTLADEPGMLKIRIFDCDGRITYTTDPSELNHVVDKYEEACYGCHSQSAPLARLNRPDRFRIYRNGGGHRVLGIITPIENQPACSNAECHAHQAGQQILGVIDTNLSLAKTDQQIAESTRRMVIYTGCALLLIVGISWFVVWRIVGVPIAALKRGTDGLASGELGRQLPLESNDEIGELSASFNFLSRQLQAEKDQNDAWTRKLEERVEDKTIELRRAHEHALQTEKMASIGKMAAVLAHEINNPLSGILTYSKLLRKWTDHSLNEGQAQEKAAKESRQKEISDALDLIARESRRCGDLVKNLLMFSRAAPMNLQLTDLNRVLEQSMRLVQHQLDLAGIEVHLHLDATLPQVSCDASQIEQVLLALIVNAIDAMPHGGNLWLLTQLDDPKREVQIVVRDDGSGIPAEILPRMFEPFLTTKETGRGVGLGLAVSRSILERHGGTIEVESEQGRGTTFTVTLPCGPESNLGTANPSAKANFPAEAVGR